jgi:tetratricopeptide (TPR) repeat protein
MLACTRRLLACPAALVKSYRLSNFAFRLRRSVSSWHLITLLLIVRTGVFATPPAPSPITLQVEQAREASDKGDSARVIDIARRALEHGENAELRNLLGKAYAQSGQPEKAITELRSAIRLEPDNEGFRFDLGQFLLRTENFLTAVTVLEEAHRRLPQSPQIQLALGVAYYCSVRYDEAVGAFLKTIDLAPDVPQPYVFLGKILEHADPHLPEIARKCAFAERVSPSNPYAPLLHAEVLIAQLGPVEEPGKADAAVRLLEKALALGNNSAEAYFVFGCLMDREGNYPRAVQLLEKSVQLKPDDAAARYRLGRLYVRLGKRAQADAEFAEQAKLKQQGHHGQQ